jgi:hypothetical protein
VRRATIDVDSVISFEVKPSLFGVSRLFALFQDQTGVLARTRRARSW